MINQKSIAVLPFYNTSNDPENQYFADGISEEIIIALSKIRGLKVTARTSSFVYRDSAKDVRHIGNELGVNTILEGSVRRSANRIRIAAQLVRTDTGFQLWSEKFDRELVDIFDLQDEISLLIAERIRENFGHMVIEDQLVVTRTKATEAYNQYLKGRYYQLQWTNESIRLAQKAYKESIAADPDYPMPYLGLSQCFIHQAAWHQADRLKALFMAYHFIGQLEDKHQHLAEYHYTKGLFHQLGNWELVEAKQHLDKSLSINPNYSEALEAQADLCISCGHFDEAKKYIGKALELNPNSPNHHFIHALAYYYDEQYESALGQLDIALKIDKSWQMALQLSAMCCLLMDRRERWREIILGIDQNARPGFLQLDQALSLGKSDNISLNEEDFYFPLTTYILLHCGEQEKAVEQFKKAIEKRSGQFIGFKYDPLLKRLRTESIFKKYTDHFKSPLFTEDTGNKKPADSDFLTGTEITHYTEVLERLMKSQKVYLDTQLSLKTMAREIDLHPNKLSWLLNHQMGKGFNEFVNLYRLKEFQSKALQPDNRHLTLLGLAYDSGFNSKSVFNEFFKKQTGLTPKAWLKKQP